MPINETGKRHPAALSLLSNGQEVRILTEQHAIKLRGTVEQCGILKLPAAVFLRREHVAVSPPETSGDGRIDMDIHVEPEHALVRLARPGGDEFGMWRMLLTQVFRGAIARHEVRVHGVLVIVIVG